jgi:hypothetical protein
MFSGPMTFSATMFSGPMTFSATMFSGQCGHRDVADGERN